MMTFLERVAAAKRMHYNDPECYDDCSEQISIQEICKKRNDVLHRMYVNDPDSVDKLRETTPRGFVKVLNNSYVSFKFTHKDILHPCNLKHIVNRFYAKTNSGVRNKTIIQYNTQSYNLYKLLYDELFMHTNSSSTDKVVLACKKSADNVIHIPTEYKAKSNHHRHDPNKTDDSILTRFHNLVEEMDSHAYKLEVAKSALAEMTIDELFKYNYLIMERLQKLNKSPDVA